jgi:hypothetical protein
MALKVHLNIVSMLPWKSSIASSDFIGSGTYHQQDRPSWYVFVVILVAIDG